MSGAGDMPLCGQNSGSNRSQKTEEM